MTAFSSIDFWTYVPSVVSGIAAVASAVFGLLVFSLKTRFVPAEKCEAKQKEVAACLNKCLRETADLRERIRFMPTSGDVRALRETVASLDKQAHGLEATLTGHVALFERLEKQVDRMDCFMKDNAR